MNRLILVGNGFDLAHKLKTSYCDFITDYLSRAINNFYDNDLHDDCLLEIKFTYKGYFFHNSNRPIYATFNNAIETLRIIRLNSYYQVNFKSYFLESTLNKVSNLNWVDLENDYFDNLLSCFLTKGIDLQRVTKLNTEFDYIKDELEKYLSRQQIENRIEISEDINSLFYESIKQSDITLVNQKDKIPEKVLFLSFNYTSTLKLYSDSCNLSIPSEINYIHGELNSTTNPLIFGFGDEYNKKYLEFEELKNTELLKHIKSFGYFKTSNYHNLIRFLDENNFQVYIFGHSLGLSDRTMLKEIFEHEKCKSIKIFFHECENLTNDFTAKTYEISKHFSDKGLMRKKIVPFSKSVSMPQSGCVKVD